jgi:uncharacterized cofD-like protein
MQRILTIGGGTGQFQILRGLKNYECDLIAAVNVADNGKSSGRLRDEYGILPPGDVRQCIVALANDSESRILREVFSFRLKDGHNVGNLMITALVNITGSFAQAIKEAGKLLNIRGKVLPVTTDNVVLYGETLEGRLLNGESEITSINEGCRIKRIYTLPEAFLYREVGEEIRRADKIVICPGDLYGSIIPNLITGGMSEALKSSHARLIYVCNLFTKGLTYGFNLSDFVAEIEKYSQVKLNTILVNSSKPDKSILDKYLGENSKLVENDLKNDSRVISGNYAEVYPSVEKTILRHVPERIAREIISL